MSLLHTGEVSTAEECSEMGHTPSSTGAGDPPWGLGRPHSASISLSIPYTLSSCRSARGVSGDLPRGKRIQEGRGRDEVRDGQKGWGVVGQTGEKTGLRRRKRLWGSEIAHLWGELFEAQADPCQLQQLVQKGRRLVHVHRRRLAWVPHCLITVLQSGECRISPRPSHPRLEPLSPHSALF